MLLYLVQHAEAKSREDDPSRSLSENGMRDIKKIADYAAKLNISVSRIVHSGKTRAYQSAEVLSGRIKGTELMQQSDGLAPMDDPELWLQRLSAMEDDIMLVGHLPHLSRLSDLLLCGKSGSGTIHFEMGCIVCMKRSDEGIWSVMWIVKPEMI